jgi:hypothetical protein
MRQNTGAAILFAVLLFGCGAAAGVLAHRYFVGAEASTRTPAEDFRQHYMAEMRSKLDLTPAQVSQLETILDQTKAKYKAVREQYHPAMLRIKNEQISEVKSILTPQQVPLYERLVAEHERRGKEQEERDRQQEQKREAARHAHAGQ